VTVLIQNNSDFRFLNAVLVLLIVSSSYPMHLWFITYCKIRL